MTYTKLQYLQSQRTKLLARLKNIQTSQQPDLKEETHLFDLLEANSAAIYKTRPREPDLPHVACEDETYHCPGDWVNIN